MNNKSIMDVVLESAKSMKFDKVTMSELESLSIPKVKKLKPGEIKQARMKAKISQNLMAFYLNVSSSTYQKWERGEVIPSGGNLKLLNLVYQRGLKAIMY